MPFLVVGVCVCVCVCMHETVTPSALNGRTAETRMVKKSLPPTVDSFFWLGACGRLCSNLIASTVCIFSLNMLTWNLRRPRKH